MSPTLEEAWLGSQALPILTLSSDGGLVDMSESAATLFDGQAPAAGTPLAALFVWEDTGFEPLRATGAWTRNARLIRGELPALVVTVAATRQAGRLALLVVPDLAPLARMQDEIGRINSELSLMHREQVRQKRSLASALVALEAKTNDLDQANRQLQELDRAKTRFFANTNHELRTPLGTILGSAMDLRDRVIGDLNPGQQRYVETIIASGEHLMGVIGDILDMAKLEAGGTELAVDAVPVSRLLRALEAAFGPMCRRRGQTLEFLYPRPDVAVQADEGKAYQILMNLLGNAHKYTPEGGRLTVAATHEDTCVRFEVRDTGLGIPETELSHLFEEFRRVDLKRTRHLQGSGLGLAIAKRLVEMHGGDIGVHSIVDQGSTFWFVLPVAQGASL